MKIDNPNFDSRLIYSRLLSYVRPYWNAFAWGIACMVLTSILEPAFPALMKYLLDDGFTKSKAGWDWIIFPLAIFLIFALRGVIGFMSDYAMTWVSQNVVLDLRQTMFEKLIRLPAQYHADNMSGRLLSRVANDVAGVTLAATTALTSIIKDSVTVVGLLAWLLYLNWKLTLISLAMVPFIVLTVKAFSKRVRRLTNQVQDTQGSLIQVLQESIEGHKVVKIFGGQAFEERRFQQVSRDLRGLFMRFAVAGAAQGPIVQLFAAMALAIIVGIAIRQASSGQATVGDFVSFVTAMLMTLAPMRRLTDINASVQRGLVAANSVFLLIDQPAERDNGTVVLSQPKGLIEIDGLSFTYSGATRPALDGLDLCIKPGECVALVGPSGSGKTTVANLLPRFFDVETGNILIDGYRIQDITLSSLRDSIALVSQEVVLFNDTVAANIAYGRSQDASREEIFAAARAAHALEFIEAMPSGFDTLIGEKGVKLSGGQRQRLAIARALLKNAPILILDEATSALDTESERQVQAALDVLMQGRTTLVVAHRLSTVEKANRIVVLVHGRVVESGTHAELLAHEGTYAQLYRLQFAESQT